MPASMTTLFIGAAFGASLTASSMYQPSIIVSQLKLENWHMIQAFLTATASTALFTAVLSTAGYVKLKPRSASPLGFFSLYDGNLIGGGLLGTGMALSGTCPSVAFSQAALGLPSGRHALAGAALGGIVWSVLARPAVLERRKDIAKSPGEEKLTLAESMGLGNGAMVVLFELVCIGVVGTLSRWTTANPEAAFSPVAGGLFIGLAQLLSLLTRGCLIGVSTAYEEVGDWALWALGGTGGRTPGYGSLTFASGVAAGAWALTSLAPGHVEEPSLTIPPVLALAGGFLMALGSRVAGGCTSGHGISGMALLSLSSFATMGAAFAVGGYVAPFVY